MAASIPSDLVAIAAQEDKNVSPIDRTDDNRVCPPVCCGCLLCLCCPCDTVCCCDNPCICLKPNEALVLTYCGHYGRTIQEAGCTFPVIACYAKQDVSLRQESVDLTNSKVADKKGNPIIVSGMLRYRVSDPVRALLEVTDYKEYIKIQAQVVLRRTCSRYPFFSSDGSTSLKEDTSTVQQELVGHLQCIANNAGLSVISFDITDLSYSPEIAAMMLLRQQAEARLEARELIVKGGIEIAMRTMEHLQSEGMSLDGDDKVRMVTNLLSVLCSDTPTQPVVQSGM